VRLSCCDVGCRHQPSNWYVLSGHAHRASRIKGFQLCVLVAIVMARSPGSQRRSGIMGTQKRYCTVLSAGNKQRKMKQKILQQLKKIFIIDLIGNNLHRISSNCETSIDLDILPLSYGPIQIPKYPNKVKQEKHPLLFKRNKYNAMYVHLSDYATHTLHIQYIHIEHMSAYLSHNETKTGRKCRHGSTCLHIQCTRSTAPRSPPYRQHNALVTYTRAR